MNYFSSINLEDGEQLIFDARKHWFLIFVELIVLVFIFILPIVLFFLFRDSLTLILGIKGQLAAGHFLFFGSIWFLVGWVAAFSVITDYSLDVVRITNRRIIDIDQRGFFSRNIATIRLEAIEDVMIDTRGLLPTLLKFGNLSIQSAGEQNEFIIKGLRHPEQVKEVIVREQGRVQREPKRVIIADSL